MNKALALLIWLTYLTVSGNTTTYMYKVIGEKTCQSNFDKWLSDFGSFLVIELHTTVRDKLWSAKYMLKSSRNKKDLNYVTVVPFSVFFCWKQNWTKSDKGVAKPSLLGGSLSKIEHPIILVRIFTKKSHFFFANFIYAIFFFWNEFTSICTHKILKPNFYRCSYWNFCR